MTDLVRLLLDYQALPVSSQTKTFMEVSGYPHYENVASNMLAFFFQPKEEHGLGDLLLSAFVATASTHTIDGARNATISREKQTDAGGRLDLLIEADGFVIGIENKIYHSPNNDFLDYSRLIERTGSRDSIKIKAVLSPKPLRNHEEMTAAQFVSVTYVQLWDRVREQIGRYIQTANPKWLGYLFDFMETTTRLSGENNGLTATDEFLINHHDVIERLLRDRQNLISRLSRNVNVLKEAMDEAAETVPALSKRWIFASTCLVHDFVHSDKKVALDLNVSLEGWELTFFNRPGTPAGYVNSLNSQPSLRDRMSDRPTRAERYIAATWPLQTPLEDIQSDLAAWVRAISEAILSEGQSK